MSAPAIPGHVPVLLDEVIAALDPQPGDVIVDATFGAGGYSRRLLDAGAIVHAFDRDPDAIEAARSWPECTARPPRLVLHPRRFSEMCAAMADAGIAAVDGLVMDIGVSSMQLDQAERGFAFAAEGPLDMRMSREGPSAADFLNHADEGEIADVLYLYGEERQSRRIARAIVAARPLETTGDLARVVRKALGYRPHNNKGPAPKDPATRSFQAIRIHVNGELDELEAGLAAAEILLKEGARLAVVSFHSLEDRIVKRFLRAASGANSGTSRHLPAANDAASPAFTDLSKAIRASEAELARNPRARSATLRAGHPHRRPCECGRMMPGTPIRGSRLRKIGWAAVLLCCTAFYLGLHLKVNAVRSEVRQAERRIVALQQEKLFLETEFETRANQQQLATWNDVDFGYKAPRADQFLEGERQLAQFGTPRGKGAPQPIMVANAPAAEEDASSFPSLVNPIAGTAVAAEVPRTNPPKPSAKEDLSAKFLRPAQRVVFENQGAGGKAQSKRGGAE